MPPRLSPLWGSMPFLESRQTVKRCPPVPQLEIPWLMLRSHPFSLKDHYFLSLSDNKTHKSLSFGSNDYISRRDCVGSIEGWLIMVDSEFWRPEGFLYPWSFCLHALQDYHLKYPYTTLNFLEPNFRCSGHAAITIHHSIHVRHQSFLFQESGSLFIAVANDVLVVKIR
ncbi:unnamed protein product [Prunus armeniaca]|uniref:F-box associated domain-containing protein n=1 Tax=Prunus armeniaca TaxID=36596 RepID=A0A6J5WA66_PRUAR|nr:unnamed protein product [Prunus armeniaca]